MKNLFKFVGLVAISSLIIVACSKNQNVNPMSQSSPSLKSAKSNSAGTGYTIQSGKIFYPAGYYLAGQPIKTGYDPYGFNYQAHMFNGWFINVYLDQLGFPPYKGDPVTYAAKNPTVLNTGLWGYRFDKVNIKWNDEYLSNIDRNRDGLLDDHHFGFPSYIGSGAWEINHSWGHWVHNGNKVRWNELYKIIAVPKGATLKNYIWYDTNGKEIGLEYSDQLAYIMDLFNFPKNGWHGIDFRSLDHDGLGGW